MRTCCTLLSESALVSTPDSVLLEVQLVQQVHLGAGLREEPSRAAQDNSAVAQCRCISSDLFLLLHLW
jgi:hypothetical protein